MPPPELFADLGELPTRQREGAATGVRSLLPERLRTARWGIVPSAAFGVAVAGIIAVGFLVVRALVIAPDPTVMAVPERGMAVATSAPTTPTIPASPVPTPMYPGGAPTSGTPAGASAETPVPGASVLVHVVGQVKTPGLVTLAPGARAGDALAAAGGALGEADLAQVNLARLVVDGEQVMVPRPGEVAPAAGGPVPSSAGATPALGATGGLVNLNTATLLELDGLPGVGPVLAQRILDHRDTLGGFGAVEELTEVSGIGDKTFADLQPLVTV